jgi:DNA-directed RNA polymerase specialized sigma24 family protein
MTDTALIKQFKSDPASGYADLLDHYTPVILRMIRRFLTDPDEMMETYTAICERLQHDDYKALRQFRINSELTPWLSVVVANACRDRFRKNRATSMPNSVVSKLDDTEKYIFKCYYQDHIPQSEIPELVEGNLGVQCSSVEVSRALAKIDSMLSTNKRWHLLAALRANRPTLSLEDLSDIGIAPPSRADSPDEVEDEEGERVDLLNSAIGELDPDDQLLVLLRFEHGMRAEQIAKIMHFDNHKYVYTRIRTIINRLRKSMTVDA